MERRAQGLFGALCGGALGSSWCPVPLRLVLVSRPSRLLRPSVVHGALPGPSLPATLPTRSSRPLPCDPPRLPELLLSLTAGSFHRGVLSAVPCLARRPVTRAQLRLGCPAALRDWGAKCGRWLPCGPSGGSSSLECWGGRDFDSVLFERSTCFPQIRTE